MTKLSTSRTSASAVDTAMIMTTGHKLSAIGAPPPVREPALKPVVSEKAGGRI